MSVRTGSRSPAGLRAGDRWATVGGATVAATALLGVLVVVDYRVAGGTQFTRGLVGPYLGVLPVAALVAVGLSLGDRRGVDPVRAGVRAAFATGLYAATVALVFLALANLRALAATAAPGPTLAGLVTNGVLLLCSFPGATVTGLFVGYTAARLFARSG
jgi:hypothetical protein